MTLPKEIEKLIEKEINKYLKYDSSLGFVAANHLTNFCINLLWPQFEQMREALEFYGNKQNWTFHPDSGDSIFDGALNEDEDRFEKMSGHSYCGGKKARASLAQLDAFMKGEE